MKNRERKKERYLRDPLPIRLAGLAADLSGWHLRPANL
jgi:hypothetical protein